MGQNQWTKRNGNLSLAGIKFWRTDWLTTIHYVAGDGVHSLATGSAYICIVEHTADAATQPGVGVDWHIYWNVLVDGSRNSVEIDQPGHTFVVGDYVRSSGVDNEYTLAQANTIGNAQGIGFVTDVDGDFFTLTQAGFIENGAIVPVATAGTVFYIDLTTPGALTSTRPVTPGQILKPVAIVVESGVSMWILSDSPLVVPGGGGGGGIVDTVSSSDNIFEVDSADPANPVGSINVVNLANNTTFINTLTQNVNFQNAVNNFITGGGGGGSGGGRLAVEIGGVELNGTVNTELDLFAPFSIPGGILGDDNAIRFEMMANGIQASGDDITIRVYYGVVSVIDIVLPSNIAAFKTMILQGMIVANEAENFQKMYVRVLINDPNGALQPFVATFSVDIAVDSTVAQQFKITGETDSSGVTFNSQTLVLEKIAGGTSGQSTTIVGIAGEDIDGSTEPKAVFVGYPSNPETTLVQLLAINGFNNTYDRLDYSSGVAGHPEDVQSNRRFAWQLTPSHDMTINTIDMVADGAGGVHGVLTVKFDTDNAGEPSGSPFYTVVTPNAAFAVNDDDTFFLLADSVQLTGGVTYWLDITYSMDSAYTPAVSSPNQTTMLEFVTGAWVPASVNSFDILLSFLPYTGKIYQAIDETSGIDQGRVFGRGRFLGFTKDNVSKGDPITVIIEGEVGDYTSLGSNQDGEIYLSNTNIGGVVADSGTLKIGHQTTDQVLVVSRNASPYQ